MADYGGCCDWLNLAFLACALAICAWMSVTDIRRGIIPDEANLALAVIGLTRLLMLEPEMILTRLMTLCVTTTLLLLLRAAYRRVRGVTGLGLGDVKLIAAASLWTGVEGLQLMIIVACVSALAEVFGRRAIGQAVSRRSRIRFAPHLVGGFVAALAFGPWLSSVAQNAF